MPLFLWRVPNDWFKHLYLNPLKGYTHLVEKLYKCNSDNSISNIPNNTFNSMYISIFGNLIFFPSSIQQVKWLEKFMSGMLCVGGGVLLATVFVHMLPEVRESLENSAKKARKASHSHDDHEDGHDNGYVICIY